MKADIATRIAVRAALQIAKSRRRVKDLVPFGAMQIEETPEDVAQREASGGLPLEELAKRLGIKVK